MFGSPSGRLMVFDPRTNTSKVLLEDVHFANGILLSSEEDHLIFAETLQYRILRYWLKGRKAGS
jgi:sugar lactone lactonase YvrE